MMLPARWHSKTSGNKAVTPAVITRFSCVRPACWRSLSGLLTLFSNLFQDVYLTQQLCHYRNQVIRKTLLLWNWFRELVSLFLGNLYHAIKALSLSLVLGRNLGLVPLALPQGS